MATNTPVTSYINIACTIVLALLSFILMGMRTDIQDLHLSTEQLQISVTAIEANRFTARDGLDVWKEIGELKRQIPSESPPKWFIERVDRLEELVLENKQTLGELKSHGNL